MLGNRDEHRISIDDDRKERLLSSDEQSSESLVLSPINQSNGQPTSSSTSQSNNQTVSRRNRGRETAEQKVKSLKAKKEDRSLFRTDPSISISINQSIKHSTSKSLTFKRLLTQAKPERPTIIAGTVCLILGSLLNLSIPALVAVIIDAIGSDEHSRDNDVLYQVMLKLLDSLSINRSNKAVLNATVVLILIISCLASFFSAIRAYLFTVAGERVVARIRSSLFDQIIHFEIGFFDSARTGELINRLSNDCTILKDSVTVNLSMLFRWSMTILIGIIYLAVISWRLTLVMMASVPVIAIAARIYGARLRTISKLTQDSLAEATETAEQSISSIRVVKSFSRELYQSMIYQSRIDMTFELGKRTATLYALFIGIMTFVGMGAMIIVLWYGATLVLEGDMTTGVLTSYVLYTITVSGALAALSGLFATFMTALGACERVFELMDRKAEIQDNDEFDCSKPFVGHIQLRDVRFSYPSRPEIEVLKGVTLDLKPGTTTALVGPSGQGKSTIVALIERFYDVKDDGEHGDILVDGVPLRDLSLTYLHSHIGYVSQETVLFNITIRENLLYGVRGVRESEVGQMGDAEIQKACEMANCWEFISKFPDGLETFVGERGIRLSGGQKQRLSIARAILLNPRVLISDEATSSLDAQSEHHVQVALERLMKGRTVLIIAHRLSTVKNADEVVVIKEGRVGERGTHDQLLAKRGLYARLVARQLQGSDTLLHDDLEDDEKSALQSDSQFVNQSINQSGMSSENSVGQFDAALFSSSHPDELGDGHSGDSDDVNNQGSRPKPSMIV